MKRNKTNCRALRSGTAPYTLYAKQRYPYPWETRNKKPDAVLPRTAKTVLRSGDPTTHAR